jgi:hypothetical protein
MALGKAHALLAAGCWCCLTLAACGRQGQDEMSWARAALERNDRLEIVAADQQSRTFTVRSKDTGDLSVVRADQVVAGPALTSSTAASRGSATAASGGTEATAAAAPASGGAGAANTAAAGEAATPASEARAKTTPPEPVVFASKALHVGSPVRPVPGQVLEAGPGYSIEAGSASAGAPAARVPGTGGAPVELRHEPIVCQGARLLHIDNLNLQFEGDAVSAEDGCEIHITNSRIRATGVGVSARAPTSTSTTA